MPTRHNNGMQRSADTWALKFRQVGCAPADAGRSAAYGVTAIWKVFGPCPHERKGLRVMRGAWFSSAGRRACAGSWEGRAPRAHDAASPPNKPMHPTADTRVVIYFQKCGAAGDWRR